MKSKRHIQKKPVGIVDYFILTGSTEELMEEIALMSDSRKEGLECLGPPQYIDGTWYQAFVKYGVLEKDGVED